MLVFWCRQRLSVPTRRLPKVEAARATALLAPPDTQNCTTVRRGMAGRRFVRVLAVQVAVTVVGECQLFRKIPSAGKNHDSIHQDYEFLK